jgi:hypothetical protein
MMGNVRVAASGTGSIHSVFRSAACASKSQANAPVLRSHEASREPEGAMRQAQVYRLYGLDES